MSRDKGYLQTISCSISLSSCRVRAESLARALNSKFWPSPGLGLNTRSDTYDKLLTGEGGRATSCAGMANVIDKPPHAVDMFKTSDGYEVGHCWVNEMPTEDDESYDTPPCSSPPSPADDEIIVNPPSALPFYGKFLRDFSPNAESNRKGNHGRNHSIFSDEAKLRDKLQQYADSLLFTEDGLDTFYDASDNEVKDEGPISDNMNADNLLEDNINCSNQNTLEEVEEEITSVTDRLEALCHDTEDLIHDAVCNNHSSDLTTEVIQTDIVIAVHPAETSVGCDNCLNNENYLDSCNSKNLVVDRRIRDVQELEDDERPKLLRSTSLKTGKTPPGTPGRKKIVRFADVLGLDLEAVRHIVCDDLPNVPSSAFDDLNLPPEKDDQNMKSSSENTTIGTWGPATTTIGSELNNLQPLFTIPANDPDFSNRIRRDWVALENITVSVLSVHCVCRVLNVAYEKHVGVRYTTDDWRTWNEVIASYVPFSSDGEFDRFSFSLYLKPGTRENQCLSFAIRYTTGQSVRWDNNRGQNYTFRYTGNENGTNLLLPTHEVEATWLHHFC